MAPSLLNLCQDGSLEEVRAALARGEEANHIYAGGITGLMLAAGSGHEAVVELLLQQPGLDVNFTDEMYHSTALHYASLKGHAGIVRRLLAHPSLTCHNAVDIRNGYSPLMGAVIGNHVECVRELLAVEEVDLETRDLDGVGLEQIARISRSQEAWQVVREERRKREGPVREEKMRREKQLKKEVLERREEAKDKLTNENIDNLLDFIEGKDKNMVIQKKKKKKFLKIENKQAENSLEKKHTRPFATSIYIVGVYLTW